MLLPRAAGHHAAVLLALVCSLEARSGQSSQPSPQPSSSPEDGFTFEQGRSRSFSVHLTEEDGIVSLTWPAIDRPAPHTVLLGVRISGGADAAAPFVEISAGGATDRQFFRAAEAGSRWLNLSFLRGTVAPGARVTLRGDGISIAAGEGALRVFDDQIDLSGDILVVAPHPDDAEIAAFGLYAFRRSTIVTVTAGNAGPPSYQAVFDSPPELYQFKGRLRTIDSVTVPWLGGIPPERALNMGYFDARLADMFQNPDSIIPELYGPNTDIGVYLRYNIGTLLPKRARASTWRNLVDDFERVLKKAKPAVIVAPHPQLDSHRDHQFTTVALHEALARWNRRVTLLLYTNHADQNRHPYGPAGTIMSLPPPPGEVILDRVYSHRVTPDEQRLKLFALDAMHDLRLSPSRLYQLVIGDDAGGRTDPPASGVVYFRRGVRSNELFFVYGRDSLGRMVDAFLTAWRARPPAPAK